MTAAEAPTYETELERIEAWRAEELERAGFAPKDAARIAARLDVDLHRAVQMVENGCSPELALQILL
jgi:hypothetical protein